MSLSHLSTSHERLNKLSYKSCSIVRLERHCKSMPRYQRIDQVIACLFCWGSYAWHGLCIFRELTDHHQDLIVATVCHAYLLMVNLYHLNELRWLNQLQWKSQCPWILYLLKWPTCWNPFLHAFFIPGHSKRIKILRYTLSVPWWPIWSCVLKKIRIDRVAATLSHYVCTELFSPLSPFTSHDPVLVQIQSFHFLHKVLSQDTVTVLFQIFLVWCPILDPPLQAARQTAISLRS